MNRIEQERVVAGVPTLVLVTVALFAAYACADVLELRNKLVEGKISARDDRYVTLLEDNGRERKYRTSQVQQVIEGETILGVLEGRRDALEQGDLQGLCDLARLCTASGERELGQTLYLRAIELDPTCVEAGRALRWIPVDGVYAAPEEVRSSSGAGADGVQGPTIACEATETIEGISWRAYLLDHPNPGYDEEVGRQLVSTLFFHDKKWGVASNEAQAAKAPYVAEVEVTARQTEVTTWMTANLQYFYEATARLKLIRRKDQAVILWVESTSEDGHSDEGKGLLKAIKNACLAIARDPAVQQHELWKDPKSAAKMSKPMKVPTREGGKDAAGKSAGGRE